MNLINQNIIEITNILSLAWSIDSSTKWTKGNPAKGQCGVTSLVINDLLGGEILKTQTPEGWHYYNKINGKRYDFTASQFTSAIDYQDYPSGRIEAFSDTNQMQYDYLKDRVKQLKGKI
ncbi:YunG family protein [Peribacillus alkalitolerans]|uniref:YunG family protein n=1 Tax=Peribacillus alkalitolerans TaxID=1550385 RepID=UPI0013D44D3E|nr:hypothetical protein [Peribacillus alkalitolerans]